MHTTSTWNSCDFFFQHSSFFSNDWITRLRTMLPALWRRCSRFVFYREFRSYWDTLGNASPDETMKPVRLCIGGDWYKYPSSFYIPHKNISVSFLRSNFHGQLPQPFPVSLSFSRSPFSTDKCIPHSLQVQCPQKQGRTFKGVDSYPTAINYTTLQWVPQFKSTRVTRVKSIQELRAVNSACPATLETICSPL